MTPPSVIIAPQHVQRRLRAEYDELGGYKPVASQYGVSAAMIWQILYFGYQQTAYEMRKKLGYVPTCPECGYEFDE